ncbi:rod shape-determining protein MreC [Tenacibaculum retecalamus]|uniref:rod shape-determining protein MreC n=1 Tax=Tenacibaculum retecalamus TaxID=3018315 RepID=UPI0023D94BD0|nr:rod shape-determining protein MreC [Tenacibaculum retecalamus]WBX70818.1 rod shape-determining protein MreC [Tenacibaculum retecalamus]
MQQLIYFFRRYKTFLFFLFLEIIAVALIFNNHAFHKSKLISSTNFITGGFYQKSSDLSEYFKLKERNIALFEENTALKNKLEQLYTAIDTINTSANITSTNQKFLYINGQIINNSYNKPNNFITINRGKKHGITTEMAVANSKGLIGITDNVDQEFARVQSILNTKSNINAGFKNSNYYGTLKWNGENYNTVQLTDIPRQAVLKIGDTIITGGKSTIFPKGILIGTISEIPEKLSASNTIEVKLFNDMSNLRNTYIITNLNKEEIKRVEKQNE